jgi:Response regulator receiver domain
MRLGVMSATIGGVCPTVLIVDNHEGFRESARPLEAEGFTGAGDAADGAAAVAAVAVARLRPDVVLLDALLPDVDGFVVAERLAAGGDLPRVVLISSRPAAAYGPRIGAAPVCGFSRSGSCRVLRWPRWSAEPFRRRPWLLLWPPWPVLPARERALPP